MQPERLFAFRLCLAIGCRHPDYLLRDITSRQLLEWQAFYQIDPFGDQRGDLQACIIAAMVNNRMRGKNETPIAPIDLMPFRHVPEQTPEQMKRTLQTILGQVIKDG